MRRIWSHILATMTAYTLMIKVAVVPKLEIFTEDSLRSPFGETNRWRCIISLWRRDLEPRPVSTQEVNQLWMGWQCKVQLWWLCHLLQKPIFSQRVMWLTYDRIFDLMERWLLCKLYKCLQQRTSVTSIKWTWRMPSSKERLRKRFTCNNLNSSMNPTHEQHANSWT